MEKRNCWWSYVTVFVRFYTFLVGKLLVGLSPENMK